MIQDDEERAIDRADFLRRFFAVAVSVGFASQLRGSFGFILSSQWPTTGSISQIFLLIFAMTVIVRSWDFYFAEVRKNPIIDYRRFTLDIVIVTLYILLLLATSKFDAFIVILFMIMMCYVLWDIFSIWVNPQRFVADTKGVRTVALIYLGGARGKADIAQGPYITFFWTAVTGMLLFAHRVVFTPSWCCGVLLAAAYLLYRLDQANPMSHLKRLSLSVVLILLGFANATPAIIKLISHC